MMPAETTRLIGKYRTPRFKYGDVVTDAVRGDVVIVGLSDARIPWPIGKPHRGRRTSLVVFGDLERAIRTEANAVVCHWWGITPQTVSKWRRVLDVGPVNPGTSKLRRERLLPRVHEMVALIDHSDPIRNAKIGDALRGRPRPKHVHEALRRARLRRQWTAAEDRLLRQFPPAEVVKRTGRTLQAVYERRRVLGLPDGRRRA